MQPSLKSNSQFEHLVREVLESVLTPEVTSRVLALALRFEIEGKVPQMPEQQVRFVMGSLRRTLEAVTGFETTAALLVELDLLLDNVRPSSWPAPPGNIETGLADSGIYRVAKRRGPGVHSTRPPRFGVTVTVPEAEWRPELASGLLVVATRTESVMRVVKKRLPHGFRFEVATSIVDLLDVFEGWKGHPGTAVVDCTEDSVWLLALSALDHHIPSGTRLIEWGKGSQRDASSATA